MIQGSAEWMQARCAKVTGSQLWRIMPGRVRVSKDNPDGYSTERTKYMREILCERLTGMIQEHYVNVAMEWGIEQEPLAAAAYEARTGMMVEECGFFQHPTVENYGATPDRLIGSDGVLEIKDPTTGTHIDTIMSGEIDEKYIFQMAAEVDCTGRKWADFVDYDSRLPGDKSFFVRRFYPSQGLIKAIHAEVNKFNAELAQYIERVNAYKIADEVIVYAYKKYDFEEASEADAIIRSEVQDMASELDIF